LWSKIRSQYESVHRHVVLYGFKRHKRRILGEIDLIGIRKDGIDLYEVKCSYRVVKAVKQLRKAKRLLNNQNAKTYFYHGESGQIHDLII
jgi:Holliday junction resolvase-like predicted endonuclease